MTTTKHAKEICWYQEWYTPGVFYVGGFHHFEVQPNDFYFPVIFGSQEHIYNAHFSLVTGDIPDGHITIRVSGESIDDNGNRTVDDYEDIVVLEKTPVSTYFETEKQWVGEVHIATLSDESIVCNYGFVKYWNNDHTSFSVIDMRACGRISDKGNLADMSFIHHKQTGWAFNPASPPTPPKPISEAFGEEPMKAGDVWGWEKRRFSTFVDVSAKEGLLFIINNKSKAKNVGEFTLTIHA